MLRFKYPRSNCNAFRPYIWGQKFLTIILCNNEDNEDKDDLDAYLSRFERACQAFDVKPEHWSTQLARLLLGQALDVYQRMSDHDVGEYQILKENLLKRFRLTEGGYRKRFKQSKIENGEPLSSL